MARRGDKARFGRGRPFGIAQRLAELSPRERQIAHLLVAGHTDKGIALLLSVSKQAVGARRRSLMRKLGVQNIAELVRLFVSAQAAGLLDRGVIAEGAPADIVVYDLDELGLLPTEQRADWPGGAWRLHRGATGWRYTIVNGAITFVDGECSGATPGQLLRHGRA